MTDGLPEYRIPLGDWVENGVDWVQDNFTGVLDGLSDGLGLVIGSFENALMAVPPLLLAALIVALAWWRVGFRFGLVTLASLALIFGMDIWKETVTTLSLVIGSSLVALVIGIPIGIAMARSDTVEAIVRPILDFYQDNVEAAAFFSRMQLPIDDLQKAMYDARETSCDAAVTKYIENNAKRIDYWVTGEL